jgi:hypothetical protein
VPWERALPLHQATTRLVLRAFEERGQRKLDSADGPLQASTRVCPMSRCSGTARRFPNQLQATKENSAVARRRSERPIGSARLLSAWLKSASESERPSSPFSPLRTLTEKSGASKSCCWGVRSERVIEPGAQQLYNGSWPVTPQSATAPEQARGSPLIIEQVRRPAAPGSAGIR